MPRSVVTALLILAAGCVQNSDKFDTAEWKKGRGNHDGRNPRGKLVLSAREAGVGVGASRADLRAMLGDPDSTGPDADIWYLGRDSMSADFRSLRVDYDASGHATKIEDRAR